MTYFKIGDEDLSAFVNELKVDTEVNYNAQTNAAGNSVVEYINSKRIITVGFIPMSNANMIHIQQLLAQFNLKISFLNPTTNTITENVNCIVPSHSIDYYTIQTNKVLYNAITVEFVEL